MTEREVRTMRSFCRICTAVCGILVDVEGDEVVRVRGDKEHPFSHGYTCPKGRALPQMHHHPERLERPQIRIDDRLQPTTWDACLDDLGSRLRTIIERDWTAPGFASAAGPHILDDYGPAMSAELRAGRTVSIRDTATDPLTGPGSARAFAAIGTRAFLNTPLVKNGRLVALLYALSGRTRGWTPRCRCGSSTSSATAASRTWIPVPSGSPR